MQSDNFSERGLQTINAGEDMEKKEPPRSVGGNAKELMPSNCGAGEDS